MSTVGRIPEVGIIMGSESDAEIMSEAAAILKEFEVLNEMTVVSAHRSPSRLYEYATAAEERGLRVLIAGAGGAAHLPGMTASLTVLPVVGVPVPTKHLNGVDSLYSIVQMPGGVPVATVGIGCGKNAGLLAVRILATHRLDLREKLRDYSLKMKKQVMDMATRVEGRA